MTFAIDLFSGIFFLVGGFLCLTGGLGLLRLPDFFARVHAAGLNETLATPLLLIGLMLQMDWSLDLLKVLLILILTLVTNPTASHSMAKAALHGGMRPPVSEPNRPQGDDASKA